MIFIFVVVGNFYKSIKNIPQILIQSRFVSSGNEPDSEPYWKVFSKHQKV